MAHKKIAYLWVTQSLGDYADKGFKELYDGIGHNNGNLAFVHAIQRHIDADITYLPWHSRAEKLNQFDAVVIPCANQFGEHTELGKLADEFSKIDKPIVAIGLGAQAGDFATDVSPSEGTVRWVRTIDQKRHGSAPNIYTRGPYTSAQLARFDVKDVATGGCPTHFMSEDTALGMTIQQRWEAIALPRNISVCGGHQSWGKVRAIEQQLIAMMMDPHAIGQYVVQSMGDMIRISRGLFDEIEPAVLDNIHQHTVPHYTLEEFKQWCNNYARSFYDVAAWMDSLRRYDLCIGPRYHGCQLAVQAGRMGVVITIDSRTEEMCTQTGVPFLSCQSLQQQALTRASLKRLIKFDGQAYDKLRQERARNYIGFLEGNGLVPARKLFNIAG